MKGIWKKGYRSSHSQSVGEHHVLIVKFLYAMMWYIWSVGQGAAHDDQLATLLEMLSYAIAACTKATLILYAYFAPLPPKIQ